MKLTISLCMLILMQSTASAQHVGIGTTTPQSKLHIVSTVGANSGNSQSVLIENTSTSTGESALSFRNAGTAGTGAKAWFVGLNQNRNFSWTYGTSFFTPDTKMLLDSTGRLGIGINTPTEKLDVIGNIKADTVKPDALKIVSSAGQGKVLVSDAAGNASWQTGSSISGINGSVGFGSWGDCTNYNISEFNPVADPSAAAGDFFGSNVSISGNYAIIGAYLDDESAGVNQGSASFFEFNGSNWVLMQKITDATGAANDYFGSAVSISGNYAVVGASLDDGSAGNNQGSVSIYQLTGGSWIFMQKLVDATGAADDQFGTSVCIAGNYLIVGAQFDDATAGSNQGSVSIYQLTGGVWTLMQKITDATGAAGDNFGNSVSLSGNFAIVGAASDDETAGADQGSASIYQRSGSTWTLMQKITDPDGDAGDTFGRSVSISGNCAAAGASFDDGPGGTLQGSATVFQLSGGSWIPMQKLIKQPGGDATDRFGISVHISGNYLIVGANTDDIVTGEEQGSATIFLRVGSFWQKLQFLSDPGGADGDSFGIETAIDGTTLRFLVGAESANGMGKAIFGKINQ